MQWRFRGEVGRATEDRGCGRRDMSSSAKLSKGKGEKTSRWLPKVRTSKAPLQLTGRRECSPDSTPASGDPVRLLTLALGHGRLGRTKAGTAPSQRASAGSSRSHIAMFSLNSCSSFPCPPELKLGHPPVSYFLSLFAATVCLFYLFLSRTQLPLYLGLMHPSGP